MRGKKPALKFSPLRNKSRLSVPEKGKKDGEKKES